MTAIEHILIYTEKSSPRVRYAFRQLLGSYLGLKLSFCEFADEYDAYQGPKICYTFSARSSGLFFEATAWMFSSSIEKVDDTLTQTTGGLLPFAFASQNSFFPFDIIAASFYLLSRYEEYLPFQADAIGRFTSDSSILSKMGKLEEPVIEQWALCIEALLRKEYPQLKTGKPSYRFIPTYDIDVAYAYKGRPLWLSLAGYLRSLASGKVREMYRRTLTLTGRMTDPYDVYAFLDQEHKKAALDPVVFFLVGERGKKDKNLNPRHKVVSRLIRQLSEEVKTGLHPSFASNHIPGRLSSEKALLEEVSGYRIQRSRQHYLKLKVPDTYHALLQLGIMEDYTMGYAERVGFRAGTSRPFPFFDLERNTESSLMIHPFAVMDGSLREYMGLSPEEALNICSRIIENVRASNGTFVSLWHNSSLSENKEWEGWKSMYIKMMSIALP